MRSLLPIALAVLGSAGLSAWPAAAQPVYRCGDTYTHEPCASGRVVDVADPRSAAQVAAAREALRDEAAHTERLARERAAAEARAARVPAGIGPTTASRQAATASARAAPRTTSRKTTQAHGRTAGETKRRSQAVRRASDRPGDADEFVAFTPGEAPARRSRPK